MGSEAQVLTALEILNFKQRRYLFKCLRQRNRFSAIDTFLIRLIEQEDEQLDRLLIYGTAEIVTRYLDRILESASTTEWTRLAKLHPEITIEALLKYGAIVRTKDWRFVACFNAVISRLAELYPDESLTLLKSLVDRPSFSDLSFQELVYFRPVEVAEIVLQSQERIRISFDLSLIHI